MGFHISGEHCNDMVTELKQYLNLSNSAWLVIKEDAVCFSNGGKYNLAGFLNRIFSNFYQEAEATVSQRFLEKNEELLRMFSSDEFSSMDRSVTDIYVSKLLDVYEKELIAKTRRYEKGEGQRFRINKENVDILRESSESIYYENESIGLYLKAIYEEYALKPMFERERIYFKETIDVLQSAISQKKKVRLSILKKVNSENNRTYTRKFYLSPYKLLRDKTGMYNYVIGYAEEEKEDGSTSPRTAAAYRISRIEHPRMMSSMGGFISKADQDAIDKMVEEKGPQFLIGDIIELKVRFTDKGIENLNRQLYMRPMDYCPLEGEKNTYIFRCTEYQAIAYFFKFANEAEILEPQQTRDKFIQRYKAAYELYLK